MLYIHSIDNDNNNTNHIIYVIMSGKAQERDREQQIPGDGAEEGASDTKS